MTDDVERRIARNESVFRDVNEAIRNGQWPGEEDERVAFRCECGRLGCSRMIELTVHEYERVRAHPRRFVIAARHDSPVAETVVETYETYVVVEKREEAGRVAEMTDPRA